MINIAIAEDDFRIAQIHEKFIEHLDGFNVIGKAINAKDTISLLEKRQPDLLLLDIYMPDELGTDLLPSSAAVFLPLISSLLRLLPKQDCCRKRLGQAFPTMS